MTSYQIVVRAIGEQHDVHARQLIRGILQLPKQHLPSLTNISASLSQHILYTIQHHRSSGILPASQAEDLSQELLVLHTAQIYHLSGNLSLTQVEQLTRELLVDPVVQEAAITICEGVQSARTGYTSTDHIIDVFFHAGVTDTLAESVQSGAQMLGISELQFVETGRRYILDGRLSENDVRAISEALFYNPVIQTYILYSMGNGKNSEHGGYGENDGHSRHGERSKCDKSGRYISGNELPGDTTNDVSASLIAPVLAARTIFISDMNDDQLLEMSKAGLLSLDLQELHAIQQHYTSQGREPTDVELETLAQTWSEHCSHKTFKATIDYREVDTQGQIVGYEEIHGLLKRYIMSATEQVQSSWLVSAFSDNAGIIRLNDSQDIAFKVETHNHPSAIEPFGGANTGVGGVIRDVLGVSAQPIACTDVLCFGPQETSADELPPGIFPPRRIASGVINGVRDYGNKMGIPTVNGAILYHSGYLFNPLVFCGCLGILPHGSHPTEVEPGDLIVCLGGRTGRDGVHGATFSSGEMSLEINQQAGTAVQIGAPITEKKVSDVIIQARDLALYHAITDCGAGGFSSAIGEMGAKTGATVELEKAPLKYQGLAPWEIWLSEAQERMILAVPPAALNALLEICAIEEVEASMLGTFTSDHRLKLTYYDQIVADMDMAFLHTGIPRKRLEAIWRRADEHLIPTSLPHPNVSGEKVEIQSIASTDISLDTSMSPTLLALLRHPNIASKEEVVRRYDHEVQGATMLKPLVGRSGNGPSDAAVLQPLIDESRSNIGIVLSNGINPLYGKIDPYHMAMNTIDEALRNLTAVGGDVNHAAILDNFCWGNPNDPEQLGMLVRAAKGCYDGCIAFKTPFISGKDSLNNEYRAAGHRLPVLPTLLISAVSVIDDASHTIDMSLKTPGNLLYLIGATCNELAGSHYAEVVDPDSFDRLFPHTTVPKVDTTKARITMQALGEAIRQGLVRACHDLSEGGLAVAAAEMSLAGQLGATLNLEHVTVKGIPIIHPNQEIIVRLFSETPTRFLVEITAEQFSTFERHMMTNGVEDIIYIGAVTNSSRFIVHNGEEEECINVSVEELQEAWKGANLHV